MARELRTAVPAALAVLVLVAVAAVAAHVPEPHSSPNPTTTASATPTATSTVAPIPLAAPAQPVPWWLVVLGLVAVLVVVGPFIWLAVRHAARRRRGGAPEPVLGEFTRSDARLPEADAVLTDAAEQLQAGGDPREVVIACWVRLEAAAEAAGQGRRPAETATDVARRWLAHGTDDRAAVDELATLFHEARYSTHPVTDDQRGRALAALAALIGARA